MISNNYIRAILNSTIQPVYHPFSLKSKMKINLNLDSIEKKDLEKYNFLESRAFDKQKLSES